MKKNVTTYKLRVIALIVVIGSAMASLLMTLQAGRHNKSFLLPLLFVIWVLSPFIGLLGASVTFRRWSLFAKRVHYFFMIVLSFGSLVAYSGFFSPPGANITGVFLIVPLICWVLLVIVMLEAWTHRRKMPGKINNL